MENQPSRQLSQEQNTNPLLEWTVENLKKLMQQARADGDEESAQAFARAIQGQQELAKQYE